MSYDSTLDLKQFAEQMSEMPEATMAERFARLDPRSRQNYLDQISVCARSDLLTHRKKSVIWGAERRLASIHKALSDAGR
jgi:hypothetical protein